MLNKKAETETLSLEFIIGIIIAVMLLAIVVGVGYKFMKVERNTQESFEELYTKISELEEGQKDSLTLQLPITRFAVVFEGIAVNLDQGKINMPSTCTFPCICLCETEFGEDYEADQCETGVCYNFEFEEETKFVNEELDKVHIEGTHTRAQTIFLKKEEGKVYVSRYEDFIAGDIQEEVSEAKIAVSGITSALTKTVECKYTLDTEFFNDNDYILHFTEGSVEITDFDGTSYSTDENDFNFVNAIADDFYIYVVEEQVSPASEYAAIVIDTVMYMSDSLEFKNKEKISNELLINENTVEFQDTTSTLTECSELTY